MFTAILMDEQIIQILPAPKNLYTVYEDEYHDEPMIFKVLCIGLTNKGSVVLLDMDDNGFIDIAETTTNFKGIKWGDQ